MSYQVAPAGIEPTIEPVFAELEPAALPLCHGADGRWEN